MSSRALYFALLICLLAQAMGTAWLRFSMQFNFLFLPGESLMCV
jgi:hypothetical protein